MAANYWSSTQRRFWQFTKDDLEAMRQDLENGEQSLVQLFPLPQVRHINIYLNQRKRKTPSLPPSGSGSGSFPGMPAASPVTIS